MREDLDNQLCSKYPKIFADRNAPMIQTCMCWGFSCGDGWYQILDSLCGQIQNHIDWSHKNHAWDVKWNNENPEDLRDVREPVPQVVAIQVKEKFGGLRFYYDGGDEQIHGMVRMAESWAAVTCEECGQPGKLRTGGWMRTLCDVHEEQRQQRMKS